MRSADLPNREALELTSLIEKGADLTNGLHKDADYSAIADCVPLRVHPV
ncbi:hypothetical protein [Jiangella gansuensis]|nr:hypothetical protein [Jiangella gansuensis]